MVTIPIKIRYLE